MKIQLAIISTVACLAIAGCGGKEDVGIAVPSVEDSGGVVGGSGEYISADAVVPEAESEADVDADVDRTLEVSFRAPEGTLREGIGTGATIPHDVPHVDAIRRVLSIETPPAEAGPGFRWPDLPDPIGGI